jgi:hypothetical protein
MITITATAETTLDALLLDYAAAGLTPVTVTSVPDTYPTFALTFADTDESALRDLLADSFDDLSA